MELPEEKNLEKTKILKKGRPKGSKNKRKRGRPKAKKKYVYRPKKKEIDNTDVQLPEIAQIRNLKPKEKLFIPQTLDATPIPETQAPKFSQDTVIESLLDDEKLKEESLHAVKEINQDPLDPSYYYRGSKNIPVAGAEYAFTADMVEELRKCQEDIVYFAENFFHIVTLDKRGKSKIKLYEAQKNMLLNMVNHRFTANLSCRQSGKSTLLTIFVLWSTCFNEDYRAAIVANKESTAVNIFKRIRLAYEQLPNYIKPGVKDYAKTGMTLGNDSSIIVSTTTATSIRGDTLNCISGDSLISYRVGENFVELSMRELYDSMQVQEHVVGNSCVKFNISGEVNTSVGWSSFLGIKKTVLNTECIQIFTESGKLITTTLEHLVFLSEKESKEASEFVPGDPIYTECGIETVSAVNRQFLANSEWFDVVETNDNTFFANGIKVHNCICLDEAAFIEAHILEEFWASVIPSISSGKTSKILMVSTPNGVANKFYEIFSGAENGSIPDWKASRIDWWDVPGRDEEWKKTMVAVLGSEEKFSQEFGNCIEGSAKLCINNNEEFETHEIKKIYALLQRSNQETNCKRKET